MALTPQPDSDADKLRQLEEKIAELERKSTFGTVRVVDGDGNERVFIGGSPAIPMADGSPQPVMWVRDGNGRIRLGVYDNNPSDAGGYDPVVWVYDHLGHIAFTTDKNGGVAEPWIPVPMYQRFTPTAFTDSTGSTPTLPASNCNGDTVWEGRIGKVSHPRIQLDMAHGRVTGTSAVPTYRFYIGNTMLKEWSAAGFGSAIQGPFDISSRLGNTNVELRVTCSATGTGTDRIAIGMLGVWMRQT